MSTLREAADEFLGLDPLAVVGVSRSGSGPGTCILERLRQAGHRVYAVNARSESPDCYRGLDSLPEPVAGVVICTPPQATPEVVRDCGRLGIRRAWIHRSVDEGSWCAEVADAARDAGVHVIPGGCPMMFCAPVDLPHRCMRWVLDLVGRLPREVAPNA